LAFQIVLTCYTEHNKGVKQKMQLLEKIHLAFGWQL